MQKSRYVQIPDVITVHLGGKDDDAPNITIPFVEYVKGCASCLICPTWPENAQRANIYAITSFILHRTCNRWYRARGCDFDITGSAEDDLPFNARGCLFYNTSCLVEEMFNNYLTRQGSGEPLPARICRSSQEAAGSGALCQSEVIAMAEKGSTVYDILRKYYGEDIVMIQNAPRQGERERFLGTPLMRGASGDNICIIKRQLNRIGRNYPAIMPLADENPDFDGPCERAVRAFQYIFDLPVTGVLDKATWYNIKRICAGIEQIEASSFAQKTTAWETAQRNIMEQKVPQESTVPETTARESAQRNAMGQNIPRESTASEATAWENAVQQNTMEQNMPQESVPPGSPATEPERQPGHLVNIGPSVSMTLPNEGLGVDSGNAVEWLRRFYGL